jgi:hypothetical protein
VLAAVFKIEIALVVELPRPVILCNVLVFHTVTAPVEVLIEVSVPAVNLFNPGLNWV